MVATIEDYAIVRELVVDIVSEGVEATVPATVRELVEAVAGSEEPLSIAQLANLLGLDKSATSRRWQNARARGYVKNLEEKKGKPARIVLADPLPDDVEILPTVEVLTDHCTVPVSQRGQRPLPRPNTVTPATRCTSIVPSPPATSPRPSSPTPPSRCLHRRAGVSEQLPELQDAKRLRAELGASPPWPRAAAMPVDRVILQLRPLDRGPVRVAVSMSRGFLSADAVRIARTAKKGKPTDADAPLPTPLPGRKHKPLPGQLDLAGKETPGLGFSDEAEDPPAA